MAFTRRNVWELGGDWADPILWYARGIKALKARPLADPTSWRFYGGIHGIDAQLWQQLGYLSPDRSRPEPRRHQGLLEPVPARHLVLPALAPRLSARHRGDRSRRGGQGRRAVRLGAALLELFQAERVRAAARLRVAELAGRQRRQPAVRAAALRPEQRRRRVRADRPDQSRGARRHRVHRRGGRRQRRLRRRRHRVQPRRQRARRSRDPSRTTSSTSWSAAAIRTPTCPA